ncbi:peptide ABC transporter substrate-binding protein [Indioceanicola profundi]|uniref:peptide ABC transporter substrate-binding protein n=1 Tax=Indioceanicola profundi TaxID=2220096 RepID=UPI001CEDBDE9|nr:peptide ABC transporter substrate-binding protein [Indioceanicola profundi]
MRLLTRAVRRMAAPALIAVTLTGAGFAAPAAAEMLLNRGNQAEPTSLDPHKGTDVQSARIGYDLFEGLLTYGSDGTVVPGAAASWEVSEDGLTYTFKLRPDGKWSDGSPVTAHDFVFAWKRLVDPNTASDYAYFLWPIKNAEAISGGQMQVDSLGAEAVDDFTLKVTLKEPTGYFLGSLVHRMTYPVQKANFEALGNSAVGAGKLVSNGAYMLAEHVPQSHVTLVKNPHFRAAGEVKVDKVVFHHSDSPETELRRFRAGELDTVQMAPVTQIDWLKSNMPETMFFYPVFATNYMPVNMTREPWASNPKLRRALSLAIDRDAIVEKITKSGERAAWTLTAPGAQGYTLPLPEEASMTQAQRDELARKLVAEAGYGPGGKPLQVEIMHATNENTRKIMVAVAAMWQQKLGAKVALNNQEWKVVLQKAGEKDYPGLTSLGWIGDFPDPYTFLKIYRSDVGKMNRSGYASAEYDRLLNESNALLDPEARMAKMAEAEAVLVADAPMIPIYHATYRNLVSPKVKGWFENPMGVQPTRYISVE